MNFQSTGGIFLRLDSSGNLNVYDASGTSIAKFIGGLFSAGLNLSTGTSNAPITSTTSLGNISTGYGVTITPRVSGKLMIFATFLGQNNTVGIENNWNIFRNTTGIPAGGSSVGTDFQATALTNLTSSTANAKVTVSFVLRDTGLTINTAYTYYIAVSVPVASTAIWQMQNANPMAIEV